MGRNDQVLNFMLKNQSSHNGVKLDRSRSARRYASDVLCFTKNGLCMHPEMNFVCLHKQEKKWRHGVESVVCTVDVAC